MTYEEAAAYIEEIPRFTKKTSLAHTGRLLDQLHHPERGMRIIHVAGTNGKGSVCAYLDSMLQEGGYRVGLFTSPHLIRVNERFMINGVPADNETFVRAFEEVMDAVRKTMAEQDTHPTYFETLFLMSLLIFRDAAVDFVILEVGMGGRLDATNVIRDPMACIITSISLDHTQYLGTTIPEIASEKAGIIKPGIPVVCDGKNPEAVQVFRQKAAACNSPLYILDPGMYHRVSLDKSGVTFDFSYGGKETVRLAIAQAAPYQMMNAALAFFTLRLLRENGQLRLTDTMMEAGLRKMRWPCRMETVLPDVVIDGAHNPDGIEQFIETVEEFHRGQEITILFGAVSDKNYPEMIRELARGIRPERAVVTRVPGSREESEETFARLFIENGVQEVCSDPSPERAFDIARSLKGNGMLFCVGSLYLAGELRAYILGDGTEKETR